MGEANAYRHGCCSNGNNRLSSGETTAVVVADSDENCPIQIIFSSDDACYQKSHDLEDWEHS